MASKCRVYKPNDQGGYDTMIVSDAEIPKGWSTNPADFEKPKRGRPKNPKK